MESVRQDFKTHTNIDLKRDLKDYSITTLLHDLEEEISRLENLIEAAEKSKSGTRDAA